MGYMEKLAAEKKAVKALYDKGMENLTDDEATELKNRFEEASVFRSASTCSRA